MKPCLNPIYCIPWFNLWFFSIRVHSWFYTPRTTFFIFVPFVVLNGLFVSIRGSIIPPFVPFVYFVVQSVVLLNSCPFVCIRGSDSPPALFFRAFRGSDSPPAFLFRAFRVFRGFEWFIRVHSCPFVVHSPSPPSSLLPTQRRPTAKCPRTTFFSLLPSPYFASIHPVRILGKSGHSKSLEYKELDIALIAQRL